MSLEVGRLNAFPHTQPRRAACTPSWNRPSAPTRRASSARRRCTVRCERPTARAIASSVIPEQSIDPASAAVKPGQTHVFHGTLDTDGTSVYTGTVDILHEGKVVDSTQIRVQ